MALQTIRTPGKWMVAGFVSFALLEALSVAYAFLVGRVELSGQSLAASLVIIVVMGLAGALIGLVFTYVHPRLHKLNIVLRGVVVWVAASVAILVLGGRVSDLASMETVVGLAVSAAFGGFFVYFGLRLGAC